MTLIAMLKGMMTPDLVDDPFNDLDCDPFDNLDGDPADDLEVDDLACYSDHLVGDLADDLDDDQVDDLACYSGHLVGDPPDDLDGDPVDDLACYSDHDQLACQSSRQSSPTPPNRPWHNPGHINNGDVQGNKKVQVIFI